MNAFDAGLRVLFSDSNGAAQADYVAAPQAAPIRISVLLTSASDRVEGGPFGKSIAASKAVEILAADLPGKPLDAARLRIAGKTYRLADLSLDDGGRLYRAALSLV